GIAGPSPAPGTFAGGLAVFRIGSGQWGGGGYEPVCVPRPPAAGRHERGQDIAWGDRCHRRERPYHRGGPQTPSPAAAATTGAHGGRCRSAWCGRDGRRDCRRSHGTRIVLAAPITLEDIEQGFADQIKDSETVTVDASSASLRARRTRRLGSLVLAEHTRPVASDSESARLLAEGIATMGIRKLPWSKAQLQLRNRVMFLRRAEGDEWPDLSDEALGRTAAEWLAPFLTGKTLLQQICADHLAPP